MNKNIEKIKQITQAIEMSDDLLDFDHVDLPFDLLNAIISLLNDTFSDVHLNTLITNDPETFDAWAIALNKSLPNQLSLLGRWQNYLNNLPDDVSVISTLTEKIDQRIKIIDDIYQQKSQINQQYEQLLVQENTLQENKQQLTELQNKVKELTIIETELNEIYLAQLQEEVRVKEQNIIPKREILEQLTKEKKEAENILQELHQLEEQLQIENQLAISKKERLENKNIQITRELIEKIQNKHSNLSESLTNILKELAQEKQEYQTIKKKLENAVQNFNKYQNKTQEIKHHLETHYQYNSELMGLLPVDRGETDSLIRNIKENLDKLDQELTKAQKSHEISQQKLNITF